MRRQVAAFAALLLSVLASDATRADEQFQRASVSTTGEAIIYVKPDEVVLTFRVETFDQSLEKAKQQNDAASAKIVKAAKDVGVEEKHLQIDTMTVELRYRGNERPINGIEGYITRRYYSAKLKDVKLLDKLIDAVLKNGANQLSGLEFRTTELRKHRDQARKMAIKAAKEKAELLAGELGGQVGGPRTITEGGSYYAGYFGGRNWMGNASQNAMQVAPAAAGGEGGEETSPLGQIAVQASVSVTFDLK